MATALLEPGDVVLVEDPCHLAALQTFGFAGARVVAVPTDEDSASSRPRWRSSRPARRVKLLYLVPTFQDPRAAPPAARRAVAVAEAAARRGFWVVEDDPYGELRYDGAHVPWIALPPGRRRPHGPAGVLLQGHRRRACGSATCARRRTAPRLRLVAKQAADLHTSTVDQAAAARYLRDSDLDAHIRTLCGAYRERRDALLEGLPQALPEGSRWNRPDGGMFVWVNLPEGYDAAHLLKAAVEHQVAYVPGAPFHAGARPPHAAAVASRPTRRPRSATGLRRLARAFA